MIINQIVKGEGSSDTYYLNKNTGLYYKAKDHITFEFDSTFPFIAIERRYAFAYLLEEITIDGDTSKSNLWRSQRNCFYSCTSLKKAYLKSFLYGCGSLTFVNTPLLEKVELGGIGYSVLATQAYWMRDCLATNVNVVIYVDYTSIADIPTDITQYANGGIASAVITYKNSTTGEVLT